MPDNTNEMSLQHINSITEENINHLVRHNSELKGIINIEARTDGTFNVVIHDGTENEARKVEGISKDKLLAMMEKQL